MKMLLFLTLFGLASSELKYSRTCDREPNDTQARKNKPTVCSNYKNTKQLDETMTHLKQKMNDLKGEIDQKFSSVQEELKMMKLKMSMEFNDTREQLQKHSVDISTLKREIQELGKHKERLGGNITGIEERLNVTERQLREKKAQLEYLETETKGAFTETQKLLKLYKDGLSHLNSTTQDLEDKVETRLHATKTDFGAKLKEVQNNSEGNF